MKAAGIPHEKRRPLDTNYSYSYAYDPIGNRITASEAGVPWTYTANNLNQYTTATENNTQLSFAYDLDGSMTYRPVDAISGWTQIWNGENRMVETFKGTDRLTFQYDYMGRRVEKCVYSGNILASKTLFVYDGFKCVEELDALDSNAVLMRHAWQPFDVGLDVILATTDGNGTSYCLHDANKNVRQKSFIVDNFYQFNKNEYTPFGKSINQSQYDFSYSSERIDVILGLQSYNYRFYDLNFGRWHQRDPIKNNKIDANYTFVNNNGIDNFDILGLICCNGEKIDETKQCCKDGKPTNKQNICIISELGEHSWITVKDLMSGDLHSYGTYKEGWGSNIENGISIDGDLNRTENRWQEKRCKDVCGFEPRTSYNYIVIGHNCSRYACEEWRRATGEDLCSFFFDNPNTLRRKIIERNHRDIGFVPPYNDMPFSPFDSPFNMFPQPYIPYDYYLFSPVKFF